MVLLLPGVMRDGASQWHQVRMSWGTMAQAGRDYWKLVGDS